MISEKEHLLERLNELEKNHDSNLLQIAQISLKLGAVYFNLGDNSSALEYYDNAKECFGKLASNTLEEINSTSEGCPTDKVDNLYIYLLGSRQIDLIPDILLKIIENKNIRLSLGDKLLYESRIAHAYLVKKNYEEAKRFATSCYNTISSENPSKYSNAKVLSLEVLSQLYHAKNMLEEAIFFYGQLIDSYPKHSAWKKVQTLGLLGMIHGNKKNTTEASACFGEAIEIMNQFPEKFSEYQKRNMIRNLESCT